MSNLIGQAKLATDTINRAAAIDSVTKYGAWLWKTFHESCHISGIIESIENIPSTDAVEVVRCKYCDWWNDWDSAGKDSLGNHVCSCAYWTREDGPVVYTADNDFCSNAERRTDERHDL